ncbi:hypothetical protein ACLOJK_026471 [Asimina triloba]
MQIAAKRQWQPPNTDERQQQQHAMATNLSASDKVGPIERSPSDKRQCKRWNRICPADLPVRKATAAHAATVQETPPLTNAMRKFLQFTGFPP